MNYVKHFLFMGPFKIFISSGIDEIKKAKVFFSILLGIFIDPISPVGIAYIKYEKASAAARAMEEMNGVIIPPHARSVKVTFFRSEFSFHTYFFPGDYLQFTSWR